MLYLVILSLIAWQVVLPWVLQPTSQALTLRRTANAEILFFISSAPTILNLILMRLLPPTGYAKPPDVIGSYVIQSAPCDGCTSPECTSNTDTRYYQRYYYLNLLNSRALVVIRQTPPSPNRTPGDKA